MWHSKFYFLRKGCGRNFHKRCVSDVPDNCSPMTRKISDVNLPHDDVNIKKPTLIDLMTGFSFLFSLKEATDFKKRLTLTGAELPTALPHCFYVHSYRSPTKCHICKRLLKGLIKQGYRCKGMNEDLPSSRNDFISC